MSDMYEIFHITPNERYVLDRREWDRLTIKI